MMEIEKANEVRQLATQYAFYEKLIGQLRTAPKVTGFVGNMEFVIPRLVISDIIRIFEHSQATLERQIEDL